MGNKTPTGVHTEGDYRFALCLFVCLSNEIWIPR